MKVRIILIMLIAAAICAPAAFAEEPSRVLILPFTINSDKDLSFLRKGVEDMLSTRLTAAGTVMPVGKEETEELIKGITGPIDEAAALQLGVKAEADYVVFGSLTVLGDSVSTDARFLDVRTENPVVNFSQFGKDPGEVLFHINLFAATVNEEVFGRKTYTYRKATAEEASDEQSKRRKHPDTLAPSDHFIITESAGSDLWRSRRFKTSIVGLAVGDVDGDGRNEAAFIDKGSLMIYRQVEGRFEKVGKIDGRTGSIHIAVDVADVNENGVAEIFVTSLSLNESKMNSYVMEWNGSKFKKIIDKQNWYYRVIKSPSRGKLLVGQKRGLRGLFFEGVYTLEWEKGGYRPVEKLKLPGGQKVFGFTYGDAMNNGQEMVMSFSSGDHLRISDPGGRNVWSSPDSFGGTNTFLARTTVFNRDADTRKRFYLPQRIHVVDIDNDGKNDIIAVKNNEAIPRNIAVRLRVFKSGYVECLNWDTTGLHQKWKTRENSGYIADAAIADLNNDGKDELVFALVAKSSPVIGATKSYIVAMGFK